MKRFFRTLAILCIALPAAALCSCDKNDGSETTTKPAPGQESTINGIAVSYIPAGQFTMGSPAEEEGRFEDEVQHSVTITKGFWICRYEITTSEYVKFLNTLKIGKDGKFNTEEFGEQILVESDKTFGMKWNSDTSAWEPASGRENSPAVSVTWFGAYEYAKWIGGELPTEAQWEYACRAGSTTAFCYGDDIAMLGEYGWFDGNSDLDVHPVGMKKPNAWGLYDMHGNAWEWCFDWYDEYHGDAVDPRGPEEQIDGAGRIMRSGSWFNCVESECRSAYRIDTDPTFKSIACGFRIIFPETEE